MERILTYVDAGDFNIADRGRLNRLSPEGAVCVGNGCGAVEASNVNHFLDPNPKVGRVCGEEVGELVMVLAVSQVPQSLVVAFRSRFAVNVVKGCFGRVELRFSAAIAVSMHCHGDKLGWFK